MGGFVWVTLGSFLAQLLRTTVPGCSVLLSLCSAFFLNPESPPEPRLSRVLPPGPQTSHNTSFIGHTVTPGEFDHLGPDAGGAEGV